MKKTTKERRTKAREKYREKILKEKITKELKHATSPMDSIAIEMRVKHFEFVKWLEKEYKIKIDDGKQIDYVTDWVRMIKRHIPNNKDNRDIWGKT